MTGEHHEARMDNGNGFSAHQLLDIGIATGRTTQINLSSLAATTA